MSNEPKKCNGKKEYNKFTGQKFNLSSLILKLKGSCFLQKSYHDLVISQIHSKFLSGSEDTVIRKLLRSLPEDKLIYHANKQGRTHDIPDHCVPDCGPKYWDLFFPRKHFNGESFLSVINSIARHKKALAA